MPCEEPAALEGHGEGPQLVSVQAGAGSDDGGQPASERICTAVAAVAGDNMPILVVGEATQLSPGAYGVNLDVSTGASATLLAGSADSAGASVAAAMAASSPHVHEDGLASAAAADLPLAAATPTPYPGRSGSHGLGTNTADLPADTRLPAAPQKQGAEGHETEVRGTAHDAEPQTLEEPSLEAGSSSFSGDAAAFCDSSSYLTEPASATMQQPTEPAVSSPSRGDQPPSTTAQPSADAAAQFFSELQDVVGAAAKQAADAARALSQAAHLPAASPLKHQRQARASLDRAGAVASIHQAGQQHALHAPSVQLSAAGTLSRPLQLHKAPAASTSRSGVPAALSTSAVVSRADRPATSGSSRASSALLVRPVPLPRITSPRQQRRRPAGLIFSPSDSPPLTPPDSPQAKAARVPQQQGSSRGTARPFRQQQQASRQSLRALPSSAYRRRRTPVDDLLTRYVRSDVHFHETMRESTRIP